VPVSSLSVKWGLHRRGEKARADALAGILERGRGTRYGTDSPGTWELLWLTGAGTGLGLSVVHGIATSLKGAITVDSKPGGGAQFRVHFPVHEGADTEIDEASAHIEPHPPGPCE
jgi:hypothetical protein